MKKSYTQLSLEEREKLHYMIWDKLPIREMARRLNRNPSTISRKIKTKEPMDKAGTFAVQGIGAVIVKKLVRYKGSVAKYHIRYSATDP
ncbi:MAG: helix-turn-helix domain-containing protein [Patescibacteria group bacterium]|nr:helix-turn-helix domain-containing protein [Patescibacteria group bacterium]MBU1870690.1 helix-turn-helix domain-containing protein [Patescibacteria group bacterium]